jgi:hypothetical protein
VAEWRIVAVILKRQQIWHCTIIFRKFRIDALKITFLAVLLEISREDLRTGWNGCPVFQFYCNLAILAALRLIQTVVKYKFLSGMVTLDVIHDFRPVSKCFLSRGWHLVERDAQRIT